MDLFDAIPALADHPTLMGKTTALIGVSTVLYDDRVYYFEVGWPRFWARRASGIRSVGIGGIGGHVEAGEGPLEALRREVHEELGVDIQLEAAPRTAIIEDEQVVDWAGLAPDPVPPCIVSLFPPRLGGPNIPDRLAIVSFLGRPLGQPRRDDLFGLVTVSRSALEGFLVRPEWPLEEALAHPDLTFDLLGDLPSGCVLRPTLTARALQLLVREGLHNEVGLP
jgi:8-oxo-dGTP pyrophosphatase MutT (NUDIX family)